MKLKNISSNIRQENKNNLIFLLSITQKQIEKLKKQTMDLKYQPKRRE